MAERRILIVFGTSYGQTAKIARSMADQLTAVGDSPTLVDAAELPRDGALPRGLGPHDFDAVIVGGSVLYGRLQRSIGRFVRAHLAALNEIPSALFAVSGAAGSADPAQQAEARRIANEFLRATAWRPAVVETVGGAITYTRYNPLMRWMLRRITAKNGGPTDTSRDHELTDWAQVRRFVESFAATVPHAEHAAAHHA